MRKWMIVDDDTEDQEIFEIAVAEVDDTIELIKTSNGLEAITALQAMEKNQLPNLIILDLNMGVMNGWECLKVLKSDDDLNSIPVFIYTTSDNVDERKQLLELGAEKFITKPSNIDGIVDAIKNQMITRS